MDKVSEWFSINKIVKAAPNQLEAGSAPETEETKKLRRAELEQKIKEARKIDQQEKSN